MHTSTILCTTRTFGRNLIWHILLWQMCKPCAAMIVRKQLGGWNYWQIALNPILHLDKNSPPNVWPYGTCSLHTHHSVRCVSNTYILSKSLHAEEDLPIKVSTVAPNLTQSVFQYKFNLERDKSMHANIQHTVSL